MNARLTAAALFLALMPALALAQSSTGPASSNDKGATGWSGIQPAQGSAGHPIDKATGKEVEVHDEALAKDRTPIATGKDLKGPPAQLPPSKIPE